jgi:hypothetical protein
VLREDADSQIHPPNTAGATIWDRNRWPWQQDSALQARGSEDNALIRVGSPSATPGQLTEKRRTANPGFHRPSPLERPYFG